ncbi:hypothetical protein SARC_16726 [Sphaeroforma arctica JP610]|uniref:Uncharacterized protein n=1 Tax=Sphaeroforma arctica JP610 TaxID=667725 RepID=A0A0L0F232_9EUKA|nr:hypothetical protein SARC_16726 [Sphaeroforma arctica JP610]KNC70747.1 hypothetical protein SARC_16726 [Sphaeroforma arctica JP610]|eukprot:XP_014144649.1 hypothetical protein SARC_16726 [Sphaeroforma arctica JP610]
MDSHVGCYGNDSQPLPTGVAYTLGDPPHTSTQPTGDERGVSAHTHTHTHTHTNTPSAETEAGCGCDETSASVEKAQVFI